jgi:hypothetical protein
MLKQILVPMVQDSVQHVQAIKKVLMVCGKYLHMVRIVDGYAKNVCPSE